MSCCKYFEDRRKRVYLLVWCLGNVLACAVVWHNDSLLLSQDIKPESRVRTPSTSVEVGGNVPVLLSGFDPLRYDQVQVTGLPPSTMISTTLFLELCEDLFTVAVRGIPLCPKKSFFCTKSPLPFNYNGGDTPVYSAGGNGSFISFIISAEATGDSQNDSHQSCGAQLINFNNLTSYMAFINNQTTYQSFSLPSCIAVGPPGSPRTTSVKFSLHEPGFYRQALFVKTTLSINSSVTGLLSSYYTSSLEQVLCNTENCTINITAPPPAQYRHVCVLALTDDYRVVEFRALGSFNMSFKLVTGLLLYGAILVGNFLMLAIYTCQSEQAEKSHTVS